MRGEAMARSSSARKTASREAKDAFGSRVLVCDGAMGTMLQAAGVSLDLSLPELSVSRPELVKAIHGAYIAAGADVIETNTFGACRTRLARFGLEDRVAEINAASVRVAREAAAAADHPVLVAGSVGPATPASSRGRISAAVLREAFREQMAALAEGGVDFILLETFGNADELIEAINAAKEAAPDLPVVAQMTFMDDGRTLAGESPAEVAKRVEGLGLAGLGANCTHGPQGLLEILSELSTHTSLPLAAQPNAGSPTFVDGRFQYATDPAYLARYAGRYVQAGAALVGGCCGTTPAHVEAMAAAVKGLSPVTPSRVSSKSPAAGTRGSAESSVAPSRLMQRLAQKQFVVIGELGAPAGGAAEQAVEDAGILKDEGASAVLIASPSSPRAQVSPTSLAVLLQQRVEDMEAILTVATWEKSVMSLQADLLGAYAFGVRHVICRTGTPPLLGDYPNAGGFWDVDSVELIQLLRGLNDGHDRHGIPLAQPTAFVVGARINPSAEDAEREIADARRKIEAGADFLITPPVYDVVALERLMDVAQVPPELPVLLGVMPLRDFNHAEYLQHEVPGVSLPDQMLERMWKAGEDAPAIGREIARELIDQARKGGRLRGVVISSANNEVDEMKGLVREAAS
jgi:methionine synthase I (cobalamin-dependent)/5,10-methylenetetrahydrofolate reductase